MASSRVWLLGFLGSLGLAGCSLFGHDEQVAEIVDAPWSTCDCGCHCGGDDPPPTSCNPFSPPGQQGCQPGDKCAWVTVADDPELIGAIACVPDGTVPLGGACTRGPVGNSGYDDCASGAHCIRGTCRDVCSFDSSTSAACAEGTVCTPYNGLFANGGDDPSGGACAPTCDPLADLVGAGTCGAGLGCYMLVSSTSSVAVCATANTVTHGQPVEGPIFANSCAPGHYPRRPFPGATTFECAALCRPNTVTTTENLDDESGQAPFSCEAAGAAPPDSATAGESCRYWWAREPFDELSPYSNTVGFCWKHAVWQYDSDGDMQVDAPFPRCSTLTHGDVVPPIADPPHDDAQYFWCSALPESLGGRAVEHRVRTAHPDRIEGWN